jgi:hypothetical protein
MELEAFHYLFTCPNYTEIRRIMMNNLNWVQTSDLNLNLLTCGSDDLTYEDNINIIKHVFNFIKSSKRLLDNYLLSNLASIQHNLYINSLIIYNISLYVLYMELERH